MAEILKTQKFDLLVNNAGLATYGGFRATDLAKTREMMDLNCTSLIELSHAFLQSAKAGDALLGAATALYFVCLLARNARAQV